MELSISRIKCFKSCRRMFQLRYVENLRPVVKAEALEVGSNYHKLLEELNTNGHHWDYVEYTKERAMAEAYYKYIFPKFRVVAAEQRFEMDMGDGNKLFGVVDGIAEDGHLVEHKSYGSEITEQYEYNLQWDEQILAYMLMTGTRSVWYTVCRKPTIRQKQNESEEEFFERMVAWYDEDTDSKIRLLEISRTDEEVEAFRREVLNIFSTIERAERFGDYYKNTCACMAYNRRCDYSSVCLFYDPSQEYVDFVKEESNL